MQTHAMPLSLRLTHTHTCRYADIQTHSTCTCTLSHTTHTLSPLLTDSNKQKHILHTYIRMCHPLQRKFTSYTKIGLWLPLLNLQKDLHQLEFNFLGLKRTNIKKNMYKELAAITHNAHLYTLHTLPATPWCANTATCLGACMLCHLI